MDYDSQGQPPSHLEHIVGIDKRDFSYHVKQQAFAFMYQLEGWCSQAKASILIDIILKTRPETVVEIGVFGGKSLVPMAYALKVNGKGKIYGIDPWDSNASIQEVMNEDTKAFWNALDHNGVLKKLMSKIPEFDLENQIELIKSTSEDAPPIDTINLLHIDGNHSEKTSYLDVTKWVPLMKSGGWIILDDITWYESGIFTNGRAMNWLNEHCIKFAEFRDAMNVWGVWIKP